MNYEQAVWEVYYWQYEPTGSFYNMLIDLYRKADGSNRYKISIAYPMIATAIDEWDESGDNGDDLFRKYKVGRFAHERS